MNRFLDQLEHTDPDPKTKHIYNYLHVRNHRNKTVKGDTIYTFHRVSDFIHFDCYYCFWVLSLSWYFIYIHNIYIVYTIHLPPKKISYKHKRRICIEAQSWIDGISMDFLDQEVLEATQRSGATKPWWRDNQRFPWNRRPRGRTWRAGPCRKFKKSHKKVTMEIHGN